jgi:two-component system cell cycle sensor histidine kinase/response regulator CckA
VADGKHLDPARFPHVNPDELVIRATPDGTRYTYASPNVRGILGYAPEELLAQRPLEIVHPDDLTRTMTAGDRRSAGSDGETVLLRNRHADGHYVWLEIRLNSIRDPKTNEVLEIQATARDVTARVTTERALHQRISAEALIAAVSRELLTVAADEVDAVVVRSLERTARFVGAERATLVVLSPDERWAVRTHQWASERDFETDEPQISITGLSWLVEQCRAGELLFVRSLDDLPREARAERAMFEDAGVRSFACLPITSEDRVSGGLAFNWRTREAEDCAAALSALVLGDVLAVALDRQRAEQALASSEARFRSLVQETSDLIVVADRDGCVKYVSPSVRQFGYSEEDLIGRSPFELVHPDDRDRVYARFLATSTTDFRHETVEYRVRDASGRWRHVEALGHDQLADPAVRGIVINVRDVSDRKEAETAMRESEERFRALVQNTSDVITMMDAAGILLYASPALEAMFGAKPKWVVGTPAFDYIHPDDRGRIEKAFAEGVEHPGRGETVRYRMQHVDGSWRYVESIGNNLLGDPAVRAVVLTTGDITERNETEEALRRSEERFRALVQHTSDMITVLDANGLVTYTSPSADRILGWEDGEYLGRSTFGLLHPDDRERVRQVFAQAISRPGSTPPVHSRLRHKNGQYRLLESIGTNLLDDAAVRGFVINSRDTTERKQLEDELLQSQKMEAVGRLAGGIAHDFNNLLTAIAGYTALLLDEVPEDDSHRADLIEIEQAATRGAALVDQLLSFSRRKMLTPSTLDLNEVVESTRGLLSHIIGADVELVTRLAPNVDGVRADRTQVEQVLLNLAVNARDAMPSGGRLEIETANVLLHARDVRAALGAKTGPHVMLTVRDTGIGMDRDTQAQVFEPFFTTKEVGQGTGLGLSTAYGIVTQARGHIGVESRPGAGTTFRVHLPTDAHAADVEAPAEADAAPRTGRETILVVEDEAAVRSLARDVLSRLGYEVLVASDGRQALDVAKRHRRRIDLLVSDVVLPRLRGVEVADRLRARRPGLRVLYISGYTQTAIVHDGLLDPGVNFLAKPFRPADLANRVGEVLDA